MIATEKIVTVTKQPLTAVEQIQASAKEALAVPENPTAPETIPTTPKQPPPAAPAEEPEPEEVLAYETKHTTYELSAGLSHELNAITNNWFDEFFALNKITGERVDVVQAERNRVAHAVGVLKIRFGL